MSADRFFWQLNSGVAFDKAKLGSDIDAFKQTSDSPQPHVNPVATSSKPLKSLVFFESEKRGGYDAPHTETKSKKGKHKKGKKKGRKGKMKEDKRNLKAVAEEVEEEEDNLVDDTDVVVDDVEDIVEQSSTKDRDVHVRTFSTSNTFETERESAVALDRSLALQGDALKLRKGIYTKGTDVPPPCATWDEISNISTMRAFLRKNIKKANWDHPTPIQMQSIPCILKHREMVGVAPTGSGKTAAFVIPLLMKLKAPSKAGLRAVVVCPTGELANQIYREFARLMKGKEFKLALLAKAKHFLQHGRVLDVLVSTPMKLAHLIKSNALSMERVEYLVFDEADKLFEMNFISQLDDIVTACTNPNVLRTLWSATMSSSVEEMAQTFLRDPVEVLIGTRDAAATHIEQRLLFVGAKSKKLTVLQDFLRESMRPPILIFVQTKKQAKALYSKLVFDVSLRVDAIHSDISPAKRRKIIDNFRIGRIWVLIATELLGRGIDFKNVNQVVNYDMPSSTDAYIHRIGRTGRAGRAGEAITFYTAKEVPMAREIVSVIKRSGGDVPEWMDHMAAPLTYGQRKRVRQFEAKQRRAKKGSAIDDEQDEYEDSIGAEQQQGDAYKDDEGQAALPAKKKRRTKQRRGGNHVKHA